ncbi:MAG: PRC-barrel domain-containing protein [Acidobacteriota bacterium]|nr:PRC-barrel domain-containing protein [Acidobacteriota bacterium]
MLRKAKDLSGYKLDASDGEIGKVKEFYFDDQSWTIRYLIADTSDWLSGRQVLISPYALDPALTDDRVIPVKLTRKQIENSPSLDSDRPVSRQKEYDYYSYYGWPEYWGQKSDDLHLRSTSDVTGRDIEAKDGGIGHVEDFVIDDETWAIRYLIVDTTNWWPGKKVLISTRWIERISWEESRVFLNLTREAIKKAPEYTDQTPITRDHESKLHRHYNREGYWADELVGPTR